MKKLALLGAGGHGKVVADAALSSGWDSIIFFDETWPQRDRNGHWPIVGDETALLTHLSTFDGVLVSLGDCELRWVKQQMLLAAGARLTTVVHPRASVSRFASLGLGTVVMAGAVVNADVEVGPACIINTGALVDHDCRLAEAVHICPGVSLSGGVQVGSWSWVGVGATVKQGVKIGQRVMVGAGAVVVSSVTDELKVLGNPARSQIPSNH